MRTPTLFILSCSCILRAQDTGRISGSVDDPSGAVVPKATVTLTLHNGSRAVVTTVTNAAGLFTMEALRPVYYDLAVIAPGFQPYKNENLKVDVARATELPPIKLKLASGTDSVTVTAAPETIETATPEVSTTVTREQIERLPVGDRYALSFITTQAGVAPTQYETVINGQRSSFSNVTLDGINIQDNYIRTGGLDYIPNQLLLDQVQEFTVVTSNQGAAFGGGASQVNFISPSGTNQFHGDLLWQNRNNALAANDFFDNQDGNPLPRLNLNQAGGSLGGPIKRDRLFFYLNYEAYRYRNQIAEDATILTANARNGIFSYRDENGTIQKMNVMNLVGLTPDPVMSALLAQVPDASKINNYRVGDSQPGQLMNTAGYSYLVRNNEDRDNLTGRLDYYVATKHSLMTSIAWNRDTVDRPDVGVGYETVSPFQNNDARRFLSSAWRWSPRPNFTNEVRGGFNLAPATFGYNGTLPSYLIGIAPNANQQSLFTSPQAAENSTILAQGRYTNTYSLQDNANWIHGRHSVKFGYQYQGVRVRTYDYSGTIPAYNLGTTSSFQGGYLLGSSELPGIGALDLENANALLASLGGLLDNASVTYNVGSRTSGFVPGAPYLRNFTYDNHAFYGQDEWKIRKNLTFTASLRWDYYTPVNERDSLELQPQLVNGNAVQTLLSNATLNFTGNSVGKPFYNKDLNNFGPGGGLAWDVFGNGKTAIRAGYGINYVTDEAISVAEEFTSENPGLLTAVQQFNLSGFLNTSRPPLPAPPFQVPLTFADAYAQNPAVSFGLIDPNLRTPYVQQWNFTVEQEVKGTIVEARYVGNHATKLLRGFDYNQENVSSNGFLSDFLRAQNNGFLALKQTGVFNPAFNRTIAGSQTLPVFAKLYHSGLLNDPTFQTLIENGEVGELAYEYQVNGLNQSLNFFPNPNALTTDFVTNYSNSVYDSLQLEVRHRFQHGMEFQGNYVFEKWLSDAAGNDQYRYEPFLDINNPSIERARNPDDLTHQFKANYSYELPMGEGHRIQKKGLERLLGGWMTSGNVSWVSGNPLSIYSGFGTFLREGDSGTNEVNTNLTKSQIQNLLGFRMTPTGPYFVAASAIGPDGRGVAPPGEQPFTGQVFFNPGAGTIGTLQRRDFTGPSVFNMDAALSKETKFNERVSAELRLEALNVFNHPTFAIFAQSVNSPQFGQIVNTATNPRQLQINLRVKF
jgi:hypothetical protein